MKFLLLLSALLFWVSSLRSAEWKPRKGVLTFNIKSYIKQSREESIFMTSVVDDLLNASKTKKASDKSYAKFCHKWHINDFRECYAIETQKILQHQIHPTMTMLFVARKGCLDMSRAHTDKKDNLELYKNAIFATYCMAGVSETLLKTRLSEELVVLREALANGDFDDAGSKKIAQDVLGTITANGSRNSAAEVRKEFVEKLDGLKDVLKSMHSRVQQLRERGAPMPVLWESSHDKKAEKTMEFASQTVLRLRALDKDAP